MTERSTKFKAIDVRQWLPWVLWCLTLVACPIAIAVLGTLYERHVPLHLGPLGFNEPLPWPTRVVESLIPTLLVVSVIASTHVFWLARGKTRWLAWGVVVALLAFTWLLGFGAWMATTGIYL
jgi:hypothetical protein